CQYASKCQYAHGRDELRPVERHPKYKTQICTTFWLFGQCAYGRRCCFLHNDIPAGGIPELGMFFFSPFFSRTGREERRGGSKI
ncbi:hypothetical protein BDY24DRAFT_344557, partial [Mrakia frigida]|uniref:uncharacterized protein n=1 Tax=Mrakia frigida TaxID=29902 RepID=UPI003FCC243E